MMAGGEPISNEAAVACCASLVRFHLRLALIVPQPTIGQVLVTSST